ncbi:hypothetical protein NPX13_g6381 [Xylaria arbuscula]|uniref:Uncharacterized protein n=1 Tax=Xylaria arbuscula TaxID=114810 RepID=A0A9W8NCM2_9PEZI|nr:hypothetical protein NPX13_g6381 [Xylaria arbuscula]
MFIPSDRISFASFGDDQFFSACSSQPTSRLMSVTAPTIIPQEQQLPQAVNSAARPSEPLASICVPTRTTSTNEFPPTTTPNVHKSASSAATTRRRNSDTDRGQSTPACYYQGSASTVGQPPLESHFSRPGMDCIFRNVRAFLAAKRHRNGSVGTAMAAVDENQKPRSSVQSTPDSIQSGIPEDEYLINTDDIAAILDIVIAGLCSIHDDNVRPNCRSLLFAKAQRAKPTLRAQNILPGVSAVVEPATTFCSTKPCFSSSDSLGVSQPPPPKATYSMLPKPRGFLYPILFAYPIVTFQSQLLLKTTACHADTDFLFHLVSRQSITEINWELFSDSFPRDDARDSAAKADKSEAWSLEPPDPRHRHVSWPQSRRLVQRGSVEISSSRKLSTSFGHFQGSGQRSTSEPFCRRPLEDEINHVVATTPITSFPRLISRSCTNDWLTPLGLFDDLEADTSDERREMVADFYVHGIDAHNGVPTYTPLPILEEGSQSNPSPPPQSQLHGHRSHVHVCENQWSAEADEHEEDCKRKPGRSIGVASHNRIRVRELTDRGSDGPGDLLGGLRQYSFLPLLDHKCEHILKDGQSRQSSANIPQEEDKTRKLSSQDLLQQILCQSRKGSSSSRSGSMAPNVSSPHDWKQLGQLREASYSEDAAPHVCIDEQQYDQSSLWS